MWNRFINWLKSTFTKAKVEAKVLEAKIKE